MGSADAANSNQQQVMNLRKKKSTVKLLKKHVLYKPCQAQSTKNFQMGQSELGNSNKGLAITGDQTTDSLKLPQKSLLNGGSTSTGQKDLTINSPYISQTKMRRMQTMQNLAETDMHSYEIFAERFNKIHFRDFTNNTRMDIKNTMLKQQQVKRNRAINYWQNNVINHFQPHVDKQKQQQVQGRILENLPLVVQKTMSVNSRGSPAQSCTVKAGESISGQ